VLSAFLARELAHREITKLSREEAFLAGLLHDIGQVAMYHVEPGQYQELLTIREQTGEQTKILEQKFLGINHKTIGASVLEKWNFPDIYVDTAREHGMTNITSEHRTLILCVSIADILADKITEGTLPERKISLLEELRKLLSLPQECLGYYKSEFVDKLQEDPLFKECQDLFHFDSQLQHQ
jgi:putative nucleotidyltransferase with HDIG domain